MSSSHRLGKYHLVAEIARGGMGVVYLAVAMGPAGFNKLLILKVLQPELVEDPGFLEMFFEEARLAARLNHPNIVQTYEVGSEGKRHYIVMDYLNGRSLSRVLRRRNPKFTVPMQLRVICEALRGLDYAHDLTDFNGRCVGIIHRDVNPQNVFITFDGQVKLVDFGIAKAIDSKLETRTGMLKGKPAYMAPEQLAGEVDRRSDIFAAGVMVWEAVAGRRFWGNKGDMEILTQLIHGQLPVLADAAPDAPPELLRICTKATARDPEERYQTAAELLADLDDYLAEHHRNVTVRDAAQVVSEIFADDHAATRASIERCLARVRAGEDPSSLSSMPPLLHETTPSHQANPDLEQLPHAHTPSTPNGTEAPRDRDRSRGRGFPLVALLGALAGMIVVGLLLARTSDSVDQPRSAAEAAPAASGVPATPPPASEVVAPPPPPTSAPAPVEPAVTAASIAPTTHAAPVKAAPRNVPRPRAPPPPPPAAASARADPPPAPSCNPPFFYDGKKKVYKPGCI